MSGIFLPMPLCLRAISFVIINSSYYSFLFISPRWPAAMKTYYTHTLTHIQTSNMHARYDGIICILTERACV